MSSIIHHWLAFVTANRKSIPSLAQQLLTLATFFCHLRKNPDKGVIQPCTRHCTMGCMTAVVLLLSGGWTNATVPVFAKSYAVVIGIDRYPSSAWQSLGYATKDARAISAFLESRGFETKIFLNEKATRTHILRELSADLAPKLGSDDRVLFFFSGHGETRELAGQDFGYLIPYDGSEDVSTWISMAEVRDISRQMGRARHQLFIFDSCYGGQFAMRGSLSSVLSSHPRYIEKISQNAARQYIAAGGKGELVRDKGPDGYSFFTSYLLRALNGSADMNGDGYVTSSEIIAYLQPAASNWDHTPRAGVLPGHEQGDFWFRMSDNSASADSGISMRTISGLLSVSDKNN